MHGETVKSNTIFRENPSSESKVIYAGRQTDGNTDMTKPIIALRHFANASKKCNHNTVISSERKGNFDASTIREGATWSDEHHTRTAL